MNGDPQAVEWEAFEHHHIEKTPDWYWAIGIIGVSACIASIIFGNVLFGVVILLGVATMILHSFRKPRMITYEVSTRGVRIHETLYPFTSLESFVLDGEAPDGPQLIVKSKHMLTPLLILPIPEEFIEEIEWLMGSRLPEAPLEEPISHRLLELIGF